MNPVAFEIGSRPIYWYGLLVASGWLACLLHWNRLAPREKLRPGYGSEMGFWIMFAGIIGARFAYVLANLDYYLASPLEIIRIDQGGLIYYGGFLGACLAVIVMARTSNYSLWAMSDFAISAIPLGHAFGRLGCFLNGCCFGTPSDSPWCVDVGGVSRHPTPLYEVGFNLAVYGFLLWIYPRKKKDGAVFATYLITYPVGRFLIEFLRGDERAEWLGLTIAQDLSLAFVACGVLLLVLLPKKKFTSTS